MHVPVLLNEVIKYLKPQKNYNFIDCTIGGGGHAFPLLEKTGPRGKILGIDLSPQAITALTKIKKQKPNLDKRLILACDNFVNIQKIIHQNNFKPVHGILLDLGLSSDLLELSNRGFSFMRDEVLDMRYNPKINTITAKEIVNHYTHEQLAGIFKNYGQERYASRVAQYIVRMREKQEIVTTKELRDIIEKSLGRQMHIKSLARIFQALRIKVNDELENLKTALLQSIDILVPGGRIVVISYHSLEDKIVKTFFTSSKYLRPIVKKPIIPTKSEIEKNKRSRSAKLRVAERIFYNALRSS